MFGWTVVKIKCKIRAIFRGGGNSSVIKEKYFRKKGICLGEGCCIYSDISTSESFLITIGNNVTISNDVQLLTHDNSIDRISPEVSDILGEIRIGDNCFIGAHAIILPGVTLEKEVVVGAGAVVTKSYPDGSIVAGNPARLIGNSKDFVKKYKDVAFGRADLEKGKSYCVKTYPNRILHDR